MTMIKSTFHHTRKNNSIYRFPVFFFSELYQQAKCGRPLGLAFDTISDDLIVADAYYGIWSVNPKTGDKKQLVSPNVKLDGDVGILLHNC